MTFYHSAEDIRIDDGHILRARLRTADGEWNDSEIDLNTCIGNDNGNLLLVFNSASLTLSRSLCLGRSRLCRFSR